MEKYQKNIAILGPSGSGKSDLSLELAREHNCVILSLDSLSIYKEIDIASAKPTKEELALVKHFGIDEIYPDEEFNVVKFFSFYKEAMEYAKREGKGLIVVGGTGFYLKMLLEGISNTPKLDSEQKKALETALLDLESAYNFLKTKDPEYAQKISSKDKYRIEKALTILYGSNQTPSQWFRENTQHPVAKDLKIFSIDTPRDLLEKRVALRTQRMFELGIIDEAAYLEKRYTLKPASLASIGLKECYQYLNGGIDLKSCKELITIHTMQLAKRQKTFNKGQFDDIVFKEKETLKEEIKRYISC